MKIDPFGHLAEELSESMRSSISLGRQIFLMVNNFS